MPKSLEELKAKLDGLDKDSDEHVELTKEIETLKASIKKEADEKKVIDKTEFDKVVNQRQELKKRIKAMETQLSDFDSIKTEHGTLKDQLDGFKTLKEELEELKTAKEEADLSKKTKAEREAILARKEFEAFKTNIQSKFDDELKKFDKITLEKQRLEDTVKQLQGVSLEVSLRDAANKYGAISPKQIVKILQGDFTQDEAAGGFVVPKFTKNRSGESVMTDWDDVDTYVKNFLEDEDNANLVKATDKKGIDINVRNNSSNNNSNKDLKIKQSEDSKLTADQLDEKITEWSEDRGIEKKFAIELYNVHKESLFTR